MHVDLYMRMHACGNVGLCSDRNHEAANLQQITLPDLSQSQQIKCQTSYLAGLISTIYCATCAY